ncbi:uncharacterized protein SPSK_08725 [Sporothrix schenckii 1099-18]|uniref:G-protein coupled receptors family 2 profile 2 domain-containing protein n=2 Tax=Sporothrix schenckii TaxID=29908 RepID=U7Q7D4_SPOS1|nr:uncharacterized protein SPSK_08725 [Sporothrix schenckii 1099-18]ERT03117.1 hypothetical protein HMPREF1624_01422 [Sporothrix schenckii ATCC 58251]KJR84477.1 hypothetical protein SPSK_08725 [Sporothrix schenckii 1099-18]
MSCIAPFLPAQNYNDSTGFIDGRLCSNLTGTTCCLPCPLTDWVYPDSFVTLGIAADWIAVVSTICCVALLLSWALLPVDKTHRHYLSICLTFSVALLSLGFVVPLAAHPQQCADAITPNGMHSSSVCGASGALLILGGWAAIMWIFLRSLSLHLQICWQVVVGRSFMWVSHVTGWGIPVLGTTLALVFSGVSFRFGTTCHINHENSLADLWIPLLVFAGLSIVVQLVTFGYCIKVYLASLSDNAASTENSGLPSYSNSIRTMTPRQAYRRVRRVIQLQWRGIAIVLIIVVDVIFFSVVFVFQDNTVAAISADPAKATTWLICLATHEGDKNKCLDDAAAFTVNEATVGAVLVLLAMNGIWLVFLLGRLSMAHGWVDLLTPASRRNAKREFVSADARLDDLKKDTRSYEMLSRDASSSAVEAGGGGHGGMDAAMAMSASNKDNDIVTSFSSPTGLASRSAMSPSMAGSRGPGAGHSSMSPGSTHESSRIASPPPALMDLNAAAGLGLSNGASNNRGSNGGDTIGMGYNGSINQHGRYGSHSSYATATGAGGAANGTPSGRRTPDYFGQTARYNAPARSFSNPRPPTANSINGPSGPGSFGSPATSTRTWDASQTYARATSPPTSPLAAGGRSEPIRSHSRFSSRGESRGGNDFDTENRHPLGMNRI